MAHIDNTIKALKGEQTFVERWQCRWGFHRWTAWSKPGNYSTSLYMQQTRTCTDCGRMQVEKVKGQA